MINIPLQAIPTQTLSFQDTTTQTNYFIAIKTCGNPGAQIMSVSISINDILIVSGVRAVAGFPLIANTYLENGNFVILTQNDDLPDYTQFGVTQYLIYASQLEIEAIRSAAALALTDLQDLT